MENEQSWISGSYSEIKEQIEYFFPIDRYLEDNRQLIAIVK